MVKYDFLEGNTTMNVILSLRTIIFLIVITILPLCSADSLDKKLLPTKEVLKEYHYKVAFEQCVQQMKDLSIILIDILHELFIHNDYWKTQELTPVSYFLSRDPTKWVYRKQEWRRVDLCKDFLGKELEHNAYYLGLFRQFLQNPTYSEQNLFKALLILETCLNHYRCQELIKKNIPLDDVEQRVDCNQCLIREYKNNAKNTIESCSKPSHFQRNWLSYFVGISLASGLGYFMYKNKANLETWMELTVDAVKKFWEEHISSPIANSLQILLRRDRKPIMTKEGLKSSEDSLATQIRTYFENNHPEINTNEIETIIEDAKNGNMNGIMKDWNESFQDIFDPDTKVENIKLRLDMFIENEATREWLQWFNDKIFKGETKENNIQDKLINENKFINEILQFLGKIPLGKKLSRLLDIRMQAKEVMIHKIMLEVENQINANRLNFELTAVLPSALMVYVTYLVSKKLFTHIVLQKNTYQPLRKALRNLHRVYNKYHNKYQIDNNDLTILDEGYCYYWIEQFKKYASQINLEERVVILEDLSDLETSKYNVSQKLQTIQRMYYNYHFLLPNDS